MAYPINLPFNPKPATIIHLDLNSCFATIEQQANPHLRGKPIAVAAYTTLSGCILAPSVEAKTLGIKVGMRVKDGKLLCPDLIVLPPDPWKYRHVHLQLSNLLQTYTDQVVPLSIDEFVLNLEGYPAFAKGPAAVAQEIKRRIKQEVGEWIRVSVGIAPNRFLAKLAAGLHKPDGLDEINQDNFRAVYQNLKLTDLCGIKHRNAARLNSVGIFSALEFYQAEITQIRAAFKSILGYYWYLRLRGWEIDQVEFARKSFGHSYALPQPLTSPEELSPILQKLVAKAGQRLRKAGYRAQGVHLSVLYRDFSHWHHGRKLTKIIFDSRDIYREAFRILSQSPYRKPVRELAISCFSLVKSDATQLDLFGETETTERLVGALDTINERWGNFVITPARMLAAKEAVVDRIAFGGIKEIERSINPKVCLT